MSILLTSFPYCFDYHTTHRFVGFIGDPAGHLKASANSGWFESTVLTLKIQNEINTFKKTLTWQFLGNEDP